MADRSDDLVYDKRLVGLNTKFGFLNEKNLDAHTKKLPDLQGQSEEWVMFTEEDTTNGAEPTFAGIEQK